MGLVATLCIWWLNPWFHYLQDHITTLRAHNRVTSVAISPDGRFLVSGGADGDIGVWSAYDYEQLGRIQAHRGPVTSLAFSAEGTHLLSGGEDGVVHLWDFKSRRRQSSLVLERKPITAVAVLSEPSLIVAEVQAGAIIVADLANEKRLFELKDHLGAPCRSMQLSPSGRTIYTAGFHEQFPRSWDGRTGAVKMTFRGTYGGFGYTSIALSPDGKILATGTGGWSILIWRTDKGAQRCRIEAHRGPVTALSFSADGEYLVSCVRSGGIVIMPELKIWDVQSCRLVGTRRLPRRLSDHDATGFTCVAWLQGPSRIVSGHADGTIRIWHAPVLR